MRFSEAVTAMHEGEHVRRREWTGDLPFWCIRNEPTRVGGHGDVRRIAIWGRSADGWYVIDNSVIMAHLMSNDDNWEIVKPAPDPHGFDWALDQMRQAREVYRRSNPNVRIGLFDRKLQWRDITRAHGGSLCREIWEPTSEDILADDWGMRRDIRDAVCEAHPCPA